MKRLLIVIAATILTVSAGTFSPAQQTMLQPIGEEAFRTLLTFYQYDSGAPLDARVVETRKMGGFTREKIVFTGIRDSRVPAYLAVPTNGKGPFPCVVQMHGYTGNKGEWYVDDSYYSGGKVTKALIAAGYAVFSIDAQYHGERLAFNDYETAGTLNNPGHIHRLYDMIVQTVVEYRRGIDYLETRPEIDANRIGVFGYSMGGMTAFLLTGCEPRVKTTVACVAWRIFDPPESPVAPYNFAKGVDGRPFLMLMATGDQHYTVEQAKALFELVDSPVKDLRFFESNHQLPAGQYIPQAAGWFKEHL